ncbi:MAG TPA: hypothetical protein VEH84_08940 [Alphaproteobacteria bacterium]|nr:hypothetical protein [Alphaproteobacteria bacterium]
MFGAISTRLRRGAAATLATVILLGAGGEALAASCASPAEHNALKTRMVQNALMQGALTCKAMRPRYNAFVRKYQAELGQHGQALTAFFDRSGGKKALNDFVTRSANIASEQHVADPIGFCIDMAVMFDALEAPTPTTLAAQAVNLPYADAHGYRDCAGTVVATAAPRLPTRAAPPPAVAPKPAKAAAKPAKPAKKAAPAKPAAKPAANPAG